MGEYHTTVEWQQRTKIRVTSESAKYGVIVEWKELLTDHEIDHVARFIAGRPEFQIAEFGLYPTEWWPHFKEVTRYA